MADRMRQSGVVAWTLVLAILTSGCAPGPAPTPSPTGFASDEEAFAAAEATYRAYVDAVNARNAGGAPDPRPTDFLTGAALQGEIESERQFSDLGIRLGGPISIAAFDMQANTGIKVGGLVCLDVSLARVIDEEGVDVTPTDRADELGLAVDFVWTSGAALVSQSLPSDAACS